MMVGDYDKYGYMGNGAEEETRVESITLDVLSFVNDRERGEDWVWQGDKGWTPIVDRGYPEDWNNFYLQSQTSVEDAEGEFQVLKDSGEINADAVMKTKQLRFDVYLPVPNALAAEELDALFKEYLRAVPNGRGGNDFYGWMVYNDLEVLMVPNFNFW